MKPNIIAESRVCNAHHPSSPTRGGRCAVHTLPFAVSIVGVAFLCGQVIAGSGAANTLKVDLRKRLAVAGASDRFCVTYEKQQWDPNQSAIIICDMWNQHWCKGATARVAELAPVMNQVVAAARAKGVFIIHAPSGTIDHYKEHPARLTAQNAPAASGLPEGMKSWCQWKDETEKKAGYPIDHSDGGCDCQPRCKEGSPWTSQIDAIEIKDQDAITDSGAEVWNLLQARHIQNVILMGVHANMCVLGRPFGLRNLANAGKNVVLMRDLTDTMYNSRQPPRVNHFTGTDLIVEHIEKYVCPTITSTVFTGKPAFRFKDDKRPLVVFLSAENEYDAAETLPVFAHELELTRGLHCEILQASTAKQGPEIHDICGMEILTDANLLVVYARRRGFPAEQMKYLRDYLDRGKPLIGLRTASHAFDARGNAPPGSDEWPKFDPEVLGGNYHNHYGAGPKATITPAPGGRDHPILKGVELPFLSDGSLYRTSPLVEGTQLLLIGTIPDRPSEPVAWTHQYKNGRVFYTSLGHPDDFANPSFRGLLINAVFWAMDKPVPELKTVPARATMP
jgi:nicotinamidase-related amidase/type 1 glutamine amidotransferase